MKIRPQLFGFIATSLVMLSPSESAETPKFSLPLNCDKHNCFLQNMMDLDPSPKRRDPFCTARTYNGHKGTDIRVRDIPTMQTGVPVLAMANGIVLRSRDGVKDKLVETKADRDRLKNMECGNGMVIDHGNHGGHQWSTQICHLAEGSLRVNNGDRVHRGQIIGAVGLSGVTQFPHVHVSLRRNNKLLDWLTATIPSKLAPTKCSQQYSPTLLTSKALASLEGMNNPLLKSGFSNLAPNNNLVMRGLPPATTKGPLIFYGQFMNLEKGDTITLVIKEKNLVYARQKTKPLTRPKAVFTAYVGRKRKLHKGQVFLGYTELWRNGALLFKSPPVKIRF